jgi:hypothetical protein
MAHGPWPRARTICWIRLLRGAGTWVAQGTIHDHFIQFTEGVVAREELAPPERARRAVVLARLNTGIDLGLVLDGGRGARLRVRIPVEEPRRV